MHVGIVSEVFVYTVDKQVTTRERWEYKGMMPWAVGVEMSASSVEGCTRVTPVVPVLSNATLEVLALAYFCNQNAPCLRLLLFFTSVH